MTASSRKIISGLNGSQHVEEKDEKLKFRPRTQIKESVHEELIQHFRQNNFTVSECNQIFCELDPTRIAFNSHTNPKLDKILGITNTKSWRATMSTIRHIAFQKLRQEVSSKETLEEKISLLSSAKVMPIFSSQRNNSIVKGAFGNTRTVQRIEEGIEHLINEEAMNILLNTLRTYVMEFQHHELVFSEFKEHLSTIQENFEKMALLEHVYIGRPYRGVNLASTSNNKKEIRKIAFRELEHELSLSNFDEKMEKIEMAKSSSLFNAPRRNFKFLCFFNETATVKKIKKIESRLREERDNDYKREIEFVNRMFRRNSF